MTIREANAANEVAREVIALARSGAGVSPALECGVATLLLNANLTLKAGFDPRGFLDYLAGARVEGGR
jgi:hypothetical protein